MRNYISDIRIQFTPVFNTEGKKEFQVDLFHNVKFFRNEDYDGSLGLVVLIPTGNFVDKTLCK